MRRPFLDLTTYSDAVAAGWPETDLPMAVAPQSGPPRTDVSASVIVSPAGPSGWGEAPSRCRPGPPGGARSRTRSEQECHGAEMLLCCRPQSTVEVSRGKPGTGDRSAPRRQVSVGVRMVHWPVYDAGVYSRETSSGANADLPDGTPARRARRHRRPPRQAAERGHSRGRRPFHRAGEPKPTGSGAPGGGRDLARLGGPSRPGRATARMGSGLNHVATDPGRHRRIDRFSARA